MLVISKWFLINRTGKEDRLLFKSMLKSGFYKYQFERARVATEVFFRSTTMEIEKMQEPLLVAFGIPTTDFSFLVSDKNEVDRYGLNIDSQREMTFDLLDFIKKDFYKWVIKIFRVISILLLPITIMYLW